MPAMLAGGTPRPPVTSLGDSAISLVMFLLTIVLMPTVYAGITYASVRDLDGDRVDVVDSLKIGLRSWFGFVGLILLMIIPLMLGFLLLVVPGVMLAVAWAVAVQAKVAERIGPIKAFGRSLHLTRGNRWRIFLFSLIILVVVWVLEGILVAVMAPMLISGGAGGAAGAAKFMAVFTNPVSTIAVTLFSVVGYVISIALGAALYQQLRNLRDGPGKEAVGEVFA